MYGKYNNQAAFQNIKPCDMIWPCMTTHWPFKDTMVHNQDDTSVLCACTAQACISHWLVYWPYWSVHETSNDITVLCEHEIIWDRARAHRFFQAGWSAQTEWQVILEYTLKQSGRFLFVSIRCGETKIEPGNRRMHTLVLKRFTTVSRIWRAVNYARPAGHPRIVDC